MPRATYVAIDTGLPERAGAAWQLEHGVPGPRPVHRSRWDLTRAPYEHRLPPIVVSRPKRIQVGESAPAARLEPEALDELLGPPQRPIAGDVVSYGEQRCYALAWDHQALLTSQTILISTPAIQWPWEIVGVDWNFNNINAASRSQYQLWLTTSPYNGLYSPFIRPGEPLIEPIVSRDPNSLRYVDGRVYGFAPHTASGTDDTAGQLGVRDVLGRRIWEPGRYLTLGAHYPGGTVTGSAHGRALITIREIAVHRPSPSAPRPRPPAPAPVEYPDQPALEPVPLAGPVVFGPAYVSSQPIG